MKSAFKILALTSVLLFTSVTFDTRPAHAVCETSPIAQRSLRNWVSNSLSLGNRFEDIIAKFLEDDITTGQNEITTRLNDFDRNTREGLARWWTEAMLPSMQEQTKQLSTAMIDESRARGSFIDAQEAARRQRLLKENEADAFDAVTPSTQVCVTDSIMLGDPSNSLGGMGASAKFADNITRGLANEGAKRATAEKGTAEASGGASVIADKWEQFSNTGYCDFDLNGGTTECEVEDDELANMDIEAGSRLLWGETLTADINDDRYKNLLVDVGRNFVDQEPAEVIPPSVLETPQGIYQSNQIRSTAARKQAIHSVMADIIADRASRPDDAKLKVVQDLRLAAGIPLDQTSDIPSLHEISHVLFQERFMTPEFATQIVETPSVLVKQDLDLQAGQLMQWQKMQELMEKLSILYASEFTRDIESIEPELTSEFAP